MEDEKFLSAIGSFIKETRQKKGLSQVEVCSKLKMDKTYLSSIENGRQNLSLLTLKKIFEAMGENPVESLKRFSI